MSSRMAAAAGMEGERPRLAAHDAQLDPTHAESLVQSWLRLVGLQFDPFLPLDAGADSHLSRYLVHHDAFNRVWGDWVTLVFAPPGGGKSALRIRVTEACYIGQETNRPFPIPYVLPLLGWRSAPPALEQHLAAMTRAAATQLLLSVAYRPHWAFRLDDADRRSLRNTLDWNLPGPLTGYLQLLRQSNGPALLAQRFNPSFRLADPPDLATCLELCQALEAVPPRDARPSSALQRWEALRVLLLDILQFDCTYVLLDGLDAVPDTVRDPNRAAAILSPLLAAAHQWQAHRVFLKGFLPSEVRSTVAPQLAPLLDGAKMTTIGWTSELLTELIRQRLYVASEGAFHNLDAMAAPDVREIEPSLLSVVVPLPREMLVLTRRVFWEHVQRQGAQGKVTAHDVDAAIAWYRDNEQAAGLGTFLAAT